MAEAHLAMLAARAALIDDSSVQGNLPRPLAISALRGISQSRTERAKAQRVLIEHALGIDDPEATESYFHRSDLHLNIAQVDRWLLYRPSSGGDYGLPPVLRTGLAQEKPEIYLLLMHLAQEVRRESLSSAEVERLRKPIIGMVTALHWFGDKTEQAVNLLYENHFRGTKSPLSPDRFRGVLAACYQRVGGKRGLYTLPSPAELERLIPKPVANHSLKKWDLWHLIVQNSSPEDRLQLDQNDWPLFLLIKDSKELLLFAQRHYLDKKFPQYDPAQPELWKEHNRPWDYDHILPSSVLSNNQGVFREPIRQLGNSIANKRAWRLEENRSRQDELAKETIRTKNDQEWSLILNTTECDDFSLSREDVGKLEKAFSFLNVARSRLLRIYRDWHDSLDIDFLVSN